MIKRCVTIAGAAGALLIALVLPANADTGIGVAADVSAAGLVNAATSVTVAVSRPLLALP